MSSNFKNALIVLISTLVAALTAFLVYVKIEGTTPNPEVSPSPTPTLSSSPLPSPSVSPSPSNSPSPSGALVLKGVVGETVSAIYSPQTALATLPSTIKAFEVMKVTTLVPSYKGAAVGAWEDPLKPVTALEAGKKYWIETTLSTPGSATLGFVQTLTKPGPMKTIPFYSELQTRQAMLAHGLSDNVANQCPIGNKYAALLRAHGIEPIKQFVLGNPQVLNGKLNLDGNWPESGCSFRQSVLTGAIAPPMIYLGHFPVSDALIQAVKASRADLPPGSWVYNHDEGEPQDDAMSLAEAKRNAGSGLDIMQTHSQTPAFVASTTWLCPVMNYAPFATPPGCGYISCMSQGNCQPQTAATVAPPTGHPMMVLDAPSGHAIAFPLMLQRMGIPRGLYFNSTQKLPSYWTAGGLYSEGGNGDGTYIAPGTDGNPWPTLRMKRLYMGLQLAWYFGKTTKVSNPVTGPKTFPQDEAAYRAVHDLAWEAL